MSKKFNIKWRQVDNDELSRKVKNFNAKRARIIKKFPSMEEFLPDKKSVKELKKEIETRQDFNRIINSLNRFSKKGAEEPIITKQGIKTTKYEIKETSIKVATINRRRARERKKADVSTEKGTMGTIQTNNLRPKTFNIDKIKPNEWDKFIESVEKQIKSTYWSGKSAVYKERYLDAINKYLNSTGQMLYDLVESLPDDFIYNHYTDDALLSISFTSDPLQAIAITESATNEWLKRMKKHSKELEQLNYDFDDIPLTSDDFEKLGFTGWMK